jgi:hypothetical protein
MTEKGRRFKVEGRKSQGEIKEELDGHSNILSFVSTHHLRSLWHI